MNNKRNSVQIDFDRSDLPLLMLALQKAAVEAMLCGNGGAEAKLRKYRAAVESLIPAEARVFEPRTFADIGSAVMAGAAWSVSFAPVDYDYSLRLYRGDVVVTVGDRSFRTRNGALGERPLEDGPETAAIREFLRDLAPMDSVCLDDGPAPGM